MKAKPFSVGRSDCTGRRKWYKTLAEAEASILIIAKTDPNGVARGDYYVDGPEELNQSPYRKRTVVPVDTDGIKKLADRFTEDNYTLPTIFDYLLIRNAMLKAAIWIAEQEKLCSILPKTN